MPVYTIEIADYKVRSAHLQTPSLVLLTDEPAPEGLPNAVRTAADQIWLRPSLETARPFEPADGACAWLVWRKGERLLQGGVPQLRQAARGHRRSFVPIHYAGIETAAGSLDLIGLEPRAFAPAGQAQPREDCLDPRIRIAAAPVSAAEGAAASATEAAEPWQRLAAALRLESAQPGAGIAALAQLAQQPGLHPTLHALCLRNLLVALMRDKDAQVCQTLLEQARRAHPDYRELDFLAAHLALAQGRPAQAVPHLQRATAAPRPGAAYAAYIGSGGETGYRAHHLLALLAEQTGHQQIAWHHFLTGLRPQPAYAPAVAGLLRQRLSPAMFLAAQWELCRLGRREPQYQRPVFDFFLLHQAWEAARNLLRVWPLEPDFQDELQARLDRLAPLHRPTPRPAEARPGVVLSGAFLMHSSVARINRALAAALAADPGLDAALEPAAAGLEPAPAFPGSEAWLPRLRALPRRLDLTIRHGWPPDGTPPPAGKLALILPWEFGAIPRAWLRTLQADEFWVPSAFVAGVLRRAGIAPERVQVIPNGVDASLYTPEGGREPLPDARAVKFLFVGGAIQRKGMDLLLAAWREAFSASDDVTLVVKDLGAQTFYRHLSLRPEIEALAADPGAASIRYLADEWSETRLPALYRAADVVVLPYRGEGFGMPLLEALACGKPVITTGAGPAPEFCPPEAAWFLPAAEVEVPAAFRPPYDMTGPMTWFEPDFAALVSALRAARAEAAAGTLARRAAPAAAIRAAYDWSAITARYRARIAALLGEA